MIKENRVKEFQEAVKKDCGKELNFDEAREILTGIVNYIDILAKIYYRMKFGGKENNKET